MIDLRTSELLTAPWLQWNTSSKKLHLTIYPGAPTEIRLIHNHVFFDELSLTIAPKCHVKVWEMPLSKRSTCSLVRFVRVARDANFSHVIVINNRHNWKISSLDIEIMKRGEYRSQLIDLSRSNHYRAVSIQIRGIEAKSSIQAAVMSEVEAKKEMRVAILHRKPFSTSELELQGVVAAGGSLEFWGDQTINKGAVRSEAHQTSRIIVFDETCQAKTFPILRIDENNVQASHASAIGKIEDEMMFYLQSRGLQEQDAKRQVIRGRFNPIIANVFHSAIREKLFELLEKQVNQYV
jgi:Fe-S cluster assembly scaffold protein SufB